MIDYIHNFRVFLRNYIYSNYDNITIKTIIDDLGLDIDSYTKLLKDEKRLSKSKTRKVIKMLNRFQRSDLDKELLRKLLCRIVFACNTCDVLINNNYFKGEYSRDDNEYFTELTISDDCLCSYVSCGDNISNIVVKKDLNEYKIKYNTRVISDTDEIAIENYSAYDENGINYFNYLEEKRTVSINDQNGDLKSNLIDSLIKSYLWRVGDFVLAKEIEKQGDLEVKRNLIGKNDNPSDKKLDCSCNFYEIDESILNLYIDGDITINEVWESVKKKVICLK